MRKFKHKKTGNIATGQGIGLYYISGHDLIAKWAVEDSNDWEEIKDNIDKSRVLALKDKYSDNIFHLNKAKTHFCYGNINFPISYMDSMLSTGMYEIHFEEKGEVILTTEDGIQKYIGDKYFCINKITLIPYLHLDEVTITVDSTKESVSKDYVFFDSRLEAEEYLFFNKSCLSLKDVAEAWKSTEFGIKKSPIFKRIREIAESKINTK